MAACILVKSAPPLSSTVSVLAPAPPASNKIISPIKLSILIQTLLFVFSVFGLFKWVQKRDDPLINLVIAGMFGILISIPFAPPGDASKLRPYAASIIFLATLPSLGLYWILEKLKLKSTIRPEPIIQKPLWIIPEQIRFH